jgi:hypothetical protein
VPGNGRTFGLGCAAVTAALIALAPAMASAATPINIGNGGNVSLVVGPDGAAHAAWTEDSPDLVQYCRVPRGTATDGCPAPQTFPPTDPDNGIFGRGLVAMSPQRLSDPSLDTVAVIWRECCSPEEVKARVSPDGGASFPSLTTLASGAPGNDNPTSTSGDAIANDAITHVGWSDGNSFQYAPLAGPAVTRRADLFGPVSFDSASAFVAGRPLQVEESNASQLSFRRSPGGDPNDEANWNGEVPIPTEGAGFKRPSLGFYGETVVGAGPYLAYTASAAGGSDRPHVREYDSASDSFPGGPIVGATGAERAPTLVDDQTANEIDIAADAGEGFRLDLVWSNQSGIWWSTFRGGWRSPILLTDLGGVSHLEVSTTGSPNCEGTPDGCGFAAARTIDGNVWVVPLTDTESPEVVVGGRSSRRLGGTVPVTATCDEDCTAEAFGRIGISGGGGSRSALAAKGALKLKADSAQIAAGERGTLKPRLKRKGQKLAKSALRRGGKVVARITVAATDLAGNETRAKRRVRLK